MIETFPLGTLDKGGAPTAFRVVARVIVQAARSISTRLDIEIPNFGIQNSTTVLVPAGESEVEISVQVHALNRSQLWWPNRHGAPTLHQLRVGLSNIEYSDSWTRRIGLRSVEVVQNPIAGQQGRTFYLNVNGVPVFSKGANWIPSDQFEPRTSRAKLAAVLDAAVTSSFNMLRVWGGGMFETDAFYELADERGIMVWEEAKFGCTLYPRDDDFLTSVQTEMRDQLRRIAYHPSIVIYSGNNENSNIITSIMQHLEVYGALFSTGLHSRMPFVSTPARLKLLHACD
jgi:beta-mannosidase